MQELANEEGEDLFYNEEETEAEIESMLQSASPDDEMFKGFDEEGKSALTSLLAAAVTKGGEDEGSQ